MDLSACIQAVRSRDHRFDGRFVHAVTSTGIYCRPSCPARTPSPRNSVFFATVAAAQAAGFRACKRCLPDASPGSPEWDIRGDLVARTMRLITDGLITRDGVPALANVLGYSQRHLERLLLSEVGAGPAALSAAQRASTAHTLIEATALPMSEVAFAAGYKSIRSFNEAIRTVYAATPTQLRLAALPTRKAKRSEPETTKATQYRSTVAVSLRLPFRDPSNVLGHLVATSVPGVEEWTGDQYRSTIALPHGWGIIAVGLPEAGDFPVTVHLTDIRDLQAAVARTRRLLDLDADPHAIDEALGADPALAPLVASAPGRRVPHTLDPVAMALRVVVGQQVSTAAARTVTGRLVSALGTQIEDPDGRLTHLFPLPEDLLANTEFTATVLAMPQSRIRTTLEVARTLAGGLDLGPGADWLTARAALSAIPGVGQWTIETIAMRALGDPDAFNGTDLWIRRAFDRLGLAPNADRVWAPWRSYAVQHLLATGQHQANNLPEVSCIP